MMADPKFRRDHKGINEILKALGPTITAKANAVADEIRRSHPDLEVDVESYTTDRGAASVLVQDSHARELQARDGLITKAAAIVGLEVRTR